MSAYSILIIDDEYPARKRICRMIEALPDYIAAGEARNGLDGLRMYKELKPDIILTDIEMPVMNGLEMIRQIRQEDPSQIIIILSCYESFSYAQQAIRYNVQDYLIKDMTQRDELLKVLRENTSAIRREGAWKNPISLPLSEGVSGENLSVSDVHSRPPHSLQAAPASLLEIRGVPEHSLPEIEKLLGELSVGFLSHNEIACRSLVLTLSRMNIRGFSQYCFMQYLLDMIVTWIGRECIQYSIPPSTVFGSCTSPLDLFGRADTLDAGVQILCDWFAALFRLTEAVTFSPRIRSIILYISEHYTEDLTLQRIADDFHISPVHLSRSFKAELGRNIINYINTIRIEKAKLLLASGHYQVSEIAYMVGFHNTQNFYNTFKKTEGTSPAEFLQKLFPG